MCGSGGLEALFARSLILEPLENFVFAEEAGDFRGGGFGSVGSVADIAGDVGLIAEISANRSRGCESGIRRTEELADAGDGVFALEDADDDGAFLHEIAETAEERLVDEVGVVFPQQRIRHADHFAGDNAQSGAFKACQYRSCEVFLHAVRFKNNESFFAHGKFEKQVIELKKQ